MVDVLDTKNIIKDPLASLTYNDIFQPEQGIFAGGSSNENPVAPQTSQPTAKSDVIEGTLRVTDGYIGGSHGWIIQAGILSSEGLGLATVKGDATWAFWAGNDTSSSAPFRVSHAGALVATSATITGSITATSGRIANWYINTNTLSSGAVEASSNVLIDSANSLIRLGPTSGNYITFDGVNLRIVSSNYFAGASGFTLEPTLVEAENIKARGSLAGATFKYDVVSAVGGQLIVANADVISTDMTALDASTMTIKGDVTLAVNDIILIRAVATSGIQEEYLRITNVGSAPTYTVTRDLAGSFAVNSNPAWKAGTPVTVIGSSDGAATYSGGYLRLLGAGTNAPHYSVFSRTGVAYNAVTERARFGNINGLGGKSVDTFGLFVGNYSAGKYLMYDDVSGDLIVNDSIISNNDVFGDGSDGDVTISSNTTLTADVYYNNLTINDTFVLNPNGFKIRVKGTYTVVGTGKIASNGGAGGNGTNASGITAGTAGAAGSQANTVGTLPASLPGIIGGNGTNGVNVNFAAPAAGGNGSNGTGQTKSLGSAGKNGANGGKGGEISTATGNGGTGGTGGALSGTVFNKPRNITAADNLFDIYPAFTALSNTAGSGGSGAGSGGTVNTGTGTATSGGGGGGAGSGGTGGFVWLAARKIVSVNGNNFAEAKGGAGGNGGNGGNAATTGDGKAGGGGGGGAGSGGNGGCLILIYSLTTGTGTYSVAGGAAGSIGTGGTSIGGGVAPAVDGSAGTAGATGFSYIAQV